MNLSPDIAINFLPPHSSSAAVDLRWRIVSVVFNALSAAAMVYIASSFCGRASALLLYLATVLLIGGTYIHDYADDPDSPLTRGTRRVLRAVVIGCLGGFFGIILAHGHVATTVLAIGMAAGGLVYTRFAKPLARFLPGFKELYVVFGWSSLALFAAVYGGWPASWNILFAMLWIFASYFIPIALSNIKDIADDREHGLKTLPAMLGKAKLSLCLHAVNLASALLLMGLVEAGRVPRAELWLLVGVPYAMLSLWLAIRGAGDGSTPSRLTQNVLLDGTGLVYSAALCIGPIVSLYFAHHVW